MALLGGGLSVGSDLQGVVLDFGFGLWEKDNNYIRNHIDFNLSVVNDDDAPVKELGFLGLRERIFIGTQFDIADNFNIRLHSIIDFNFAIISEKDSPSAIFNKAPFVLEPRIGFGVEFMMIQDFKDKKYVQSFFVEFLTGPQLYTKSSTYPESSPSFVTIALGMRFSIY